MPPSHGVVHAKSRECYPRDDKSSIADNVSRNQATVARRRELLREFPCRACGIDEPDVIQWHHVNPEDKLYEVTRGGVAEEKFWDEVLKCIPVCTNCHKKIHKEKLCLLPINHIGSKPLAVTENTCVQDSTCHR